MQVTLDIPDELAAQAKACGIPLEAYLQGLVKQAAQQTSEMARRKQIDDAFAAMSADVDYQREARKIEKEFEKSDWEAFAAAEKR